MTESLCGLPKGARKKILEWQALMSLMNLRGMNEAVGKCINGVPHRVQ